MGCRIIGIRNRSLGLMQRNCSLRLESGRRVPIIEDFVIVRLRISTNRLVSGRIKDGGRVWVGWISGRIRYTSVGSLVIASSHRGLRRREKSFLKMNVPSNATITMENLQKEIGSKGQATKNQAVLTCDNGQKRVRCEEESK